MRVRRRPVHRLIARAACPRGVAAAVTEARLMAHQHLLWTESVPVRAARRWVSDPLPGRGLYQLAQHDASLWLSADQPLGHDAPARNAARRGWSRLSDRDVQLLGLLYELGPGVRRVDVRDQLT
jgi:hypothetical protein